MERPELINKLIFLNQYDSYLEIGVQSGFTFKKINCSNKIGVDPDKNAHATHYMTSDDFFKNYSETFDIVFIDGLHHEEQVMKDIQNSLSCINENGTIVCHDILPSNEAMQRVPRETKEWTGDCWKAFVKVSHESFGLDSFVINDDCGLGVIRKVDNKKFSNHKDKSIFKKDLTYSDFLKYKNTWLNIIEPDEVSDNILKNPDIY